MKVHRSARGMGFKGKTGIPQEANAADCVVLRSLHEKVHVVPGNQRILDALKSDMRYVQKQKVKHEMGYVLRYFFIKSRSCVTDCRNRLETIFAKACCVR